MTARVTIDGREVVVTPTGARLLTAMLMHGGWRSDVDRIAHPQTRDRLVHTGLLVPDPDRHGAYQLTPAGRTAAHQVTKVEL